MQAVELEACATEHERDVEAGEGKSGIVCKGGSCEGGAVDVDCYLHDVWEGEAAGLAGVEGLIAEVACGVVDDLLFDDEGYDDLACLE